MKTVFQSHSEEDTRKWGLKFASSLRAGDVIGISGEFGAGKTRIIKAFCEYFGIDPDSVTSPSFTLVHEYYGKRKIVHLDTYRLKSDVEFEMLDIDYYMDKKTILLIEWADRVRHLLPENSKMIEIRVTGKSTRKIIIK